MKKIIILLMIILVISTSTTTSIAGGPWKGKIIDIDTKEPIEGAVVLAIWERAYRTVSGDKTYFYEAKEVLTDKDGKFEIPAYTPINLLPLISYIKGPYFIIFKPGYLSLEEHIDENIIDKKVELQKFGKVYRLSPGIIELPKLKTKEERIKNLLLTGVMYEEVEKKAKNYMHLLNIERHNLSLDSIPMERRQY